MNDANYQTLARNVITQTLRDMRNRAMVDECIEFFSSKQPAVAQLREHWYEVADLPSDTRERLALIDKDLIRRASDRMIGRSRLGFLAALVDEINSLGPPERGSSCGSSRMVPVGFQPSALRT